MTINTGNYQSIRPAVGVRIEVEPDEFVEKYNQLSDLVEKMFQVEVASLYADQKHINIVGIKKYTNDTIEDSETLMDEIKELTKGLK